MIELVQRNAEVTIPFLVSSRGYGFLWNSPAIGRVELATNGTRWVADSARQIDYWVTAGAAGRDACATTPTPPATRRCCPSGRPGSGSASCATARRRNCSRSPASTGAAASRSTSSSADFFHWTHLGDWRFDPAEWPDPAAAVKELAERWHPADGLGLALGQPAVGESTPKWSGAGPVHRHRVRPGRARRLAGQGRGQDGPGRLLRRDQPAGPRVRLVEDPGELPRATASNCGGWTPANRSSSPATRPTCATTPDPAWRSATCTRGRTPAPSSTACGPRAAPRWSP